MTSTKRLAFFAALLGLSLAAGSARAADSVRIVAMNPPSPASLAGVPTGGSMGPGNSIEIVFAYNLNTHANARISFYTAGEPGNPAHTGLGIPFMVAKKGKGEGRTRISVRCDGSFASCHVVNLRYDMFFDVPAPGSGLLTLFEDHKVVDYTFKCPNIPGNPTGGPGPTHTPSTSTHPGSNRPNITSARPGLYIWGSDPTKKHWVDWNTAVNLTSAESLFPTRGNGECAFNVEYYEKETNGIATGPFMDKIYSDAHERAVNGPFPLAASEVKTITKQPYLDPGAHGLKLVLDAAGNVLESNESENSFSLRYVLEGRCGGPTTAGVPPK